MKEGIKTCESDSPNPGGQHRRLRMGPKTAQERIKRDTVEKQENLSPFLTSFSGQTSV